MSTYVCKKRIFKKEDVRRLYLFFDNGDYAEIRSPEICDLSVILYDKLIAGDKGVRAVAADGYLRLKPNNKRASATSHAVENERPFCFDRKKYLVDRCIYDQDVCEIWLIDDLNWHHAISCRIKGSYAGDCLTLRFVPQPWMGRVDSPDHYVNLFTPTRELIHSIDLDFENCESFTVYQHEIVAFHPKYDHTLEWGSSEYNRKIIGGHMILKLNFPDRTHHLFFANQNKLPKDKDFLQRLCGKKGADEVDICHLYMTYGFPGYGRNQEECFELDSIWTPDPKKAVPNDGFDPFVSGYCKLRSDGKIVIGFGKDAKAIVQQHLQ